MGRNESQRSTHRHYNFPEGMKISNTLSRPVKSRSSSDVEGCDEVQLQALVTEDGLEHIEEDVDEYGIAGKIWCAENRPSCFQHTFTVHIFRAGKQLLT